MGQWHYRKIILWPLIPGSRDPEKLQIWVMGNSIVYWASKDFNFNASIHLPHMQDKCATTFMGACRLNIDKALSLVNYQLDRKKPTPNLILLHVGSNDIETDTFSDFPSKCTKLCNQIADTFVAYVNDDPKWVLVGIILSEVLPCMEYKRGLSLVEGQTHTQITNAMLQSIAVSWDSVTIMHPLITPDKLYFYCYQFDRKDKSTCHLRGSQYSSCV